MIVKIKPWWWVSLIEYARCRELSDAVVAERVCSHVYCMHICGCVMTVYFCR
jgi:hypothetical protein